MIKKRQYHNLTYRVTVYYRPYHKWIWEGDYESLAWAWHGLKKALDVEKKYSRGRIEINWEDK